MSERAVAQRASLERKLYTYPEVRRAMEEGRLSYEKARMVVRCPDPWSIDAWIRRAEGLTCLQVRREVEAVEEEQMRAQRSLHLSVPERVEALVRAAVQAARGVAKAETGRWEDDAARLARIADHFVATWRGLVDERRPTRHRRVLERDGGVCTVPGCSREAVHAHHVRFASRGGSDHPSNLTSLCAAHHLHGVHAGHLRVSGTAPDRLVWRLRRAA